VTSVVVLVGIGLVQNFWVAIALVAVWGVMTSIDDPVHRAYLNDMIPSKQRATVLSFDSLMGSGGSAIAQPILGRSADIGGYGFSLLLSGIISAGAIPFVLLSRAQRAPADTATATLEGPSIDPATSV
jgi:MFS family permease